MILFLLKVEEYEKGDRLFEKTLPGIQRPVLVFYIYHKNEKGKASKKDLPL
jgi:hypothetical protein